MKKRSKLTVTSVAEYIECSPRRVSRLKRKLITNNFQIFIRTYNFLSVQRCLPRTEGIFYMEYEIEGFCFRVRINCKPYFTFLCSNELFPQISACLLFIFSQFAKPYRSLMKKTAKQTATDTYETSDILAITHKTIKTTSFAA